MAVTTGRDATGDRRRQLALITELREVEHWRRLVSARIDLAVAAVAAIDEPVVRNLPEAPTVPFGLRDLVGLAPAGQARGEVETLLRLRTVQRDLDAYALALRTTTRTATADLLSRLDEPAGLPQEAGDDAAPLAPVLLLEARRRRRHDPDGVA